MQMAVYPRNKLERYVTRDSAGKFCRLQEIVQRDWRIYFYKLVRRILCCFGVNKGLINCNLDSGILKTRPCDRWLSKGVTLQYYNGSCGFVTDSYIQTKQKQQNNIMKSTV